MVKNIDPIDLEEVDLVNFLRSHLTTEEELAGDDYEFSDTGKHLAYVRVSTIDQNEERQREGLAPHKIDKWYVEKVSAKDANRPQLLNLLDWVREGDTIYVHDFSRLARNTEDLLTIVKFLKKKHVRLVSNKESIDTQTPVGKMFLTILAAIYEFERTNMLDRQREGIDIAKKNDEGKDWKDRTYKGRQPFDERKKFDKAKFEWLYEKYLAREISKSEFARQIGASRPTLDKLLKKRIAIVKNA